MVWGGGGGGVKELGRRVPKASIIMFHKMKEGKYIALCLNLEMKYHLNSTAIIAECKKANKTTRKAICRL